MSSSKCTLFPSLRLRLPLFVFLNIYDNSCFIGLQFSHVLVFLVLWFETVPFRWFCGWLVFLFFVAPSLAVFCRASVFNSDVSKWNTGAVIDMRNSKFIRTLWPRLPLLCF
jgi:surface protein